MGGGHRGSWGIDSERAGVCYVPEEEPKRRRKQMGANGDKKQNLGNWGKEEDEREGEDRNDTNLNKGLMHQTLKKLSSRTVCLIRRSRVEV